ncbi:hypothetical protein MLD38_014688 [Melastoma candidum]|uniref:Uncharacterized protein n=1 Tax=Melastoma candidum TaxID=119954 RepID=A0ACB9RDN0_9MYRT|nr:hypothetical protein MLD38_014688 [Melastoma candidum]
MTDRVYPSSKPNANAKANGNGNVAAPNGTSAAHPPPPVPAPAPSKAQLYRPYNPPASQHRRHGRRRTDGCRCSPCRCCFWTILLILLILLIAATVSAVLYLLYHPHKPSFTVSYLQTGRLNLSSSSAAASSPSLSASFNLTLLAKNPNSHIFTYFFDPTVVSLLSSSSVLLGNSTLPAFVSFPKNQTSFRNVVASGDFQDLDADSVTALRSDLRKKNGVPLTVQLDTKISVKAGGLKSKRVGIRVTCDGFRGVVPPKGKAAAVASVGESKCTVDLRIKIWKFTF